MADEGTAPDTEDKTRRSVEAFKDDQPIALGPTWTLASALNLPATTALLLALLYGVGAFTRSAELKNAGVPVNVALPLVPLTQDLARGIQVVVEPTVLLVGLLLVVALVILDADPTADKPKVSLASGRSKVAVALLVLLGVALLILAPYVAGSVVIAVVAVILVLALSAPEGHRISVVTKVRLGPRYRASTAVLAASVAVGLASAAVVLELLGRFYLPRP